MDTALWIYVVLIFSWSKTTNVPVGYCSHLMSVLTSSCYLQQHRDTMAGKLAAVWPVEQLLWSYTMAQLCTDSTV